MAKKYVTLNLTHNEMIELVGLVHLGHYMKYGRVAPGVDRKRKLKIPDYELPHKVYRAACEAKVEGAATYVSEIEEYTLQPDLENELSDLIDEYDFQAMLDTLEMKLAQVTILLKYGASKIQKAGEDQYTDELFEAMRHYQNLIVDNWGPFIESLVETWGPEGRMYR